MSQAEDRLGTSTAELARLKAINASGKAVSLTDDALSKLMVGNWTTGRHDYVYRADGTWQMLPIEPGGTSGTWKIEQSKLIEGKTQRVILEASEKQFTLRNTEGDYPYRYVKITTPAIKPAVDPVGEWTTKGRQSELFMTLWKSGEFRGEFDTKDTSIHLEGTWKLFQEGRWAGYVTISGRITYWGAGQEDVTPKDGRFEFLFDPADSKLTYVKGGVLKDRNGALFHPTGPQANDDPVLVRQNNSRPERIEPGNH